MVALVAHVLRVVLLVEMRAQEGVLLNIDFSWPIYRLQRLLLKVTDRFLAKDLDLPGL